MYRREGWGGVFVSWPGAAPAADKPVLGPVHSPQCPPVSILVLFLESVKTVGIGHS